MVVAAPSPPLALDVTTTSNSELTIKWQPPQEPNGNVTHYVITGSLIKDDETILDQRNYCNERKCSRLFRCKIVTDQIWDELSVAKNWVYSLVSTSFRLCMHIYVVWQKSNKTDFLLSLNFILFTNQGYPLQNSSLGQLHSDGGVVSIVRSSAGRLLLVYLSACRLRSSGYYLEY